MTPADCDLRGMEWMPLYGHRLFGSDFDAHASDAEFRAGMNLWWSAWNQVPAASLPDDDTALCRLAGCGRDLKTWRKIKTRALHGFVQCEDGRLYHKAQAPFAIEAWERRLKDRERKAKWREKKTGQDADRNATGTGTGRGQDADGDGDGTVPETSLERLTGQDRTGQDRTLKYNSAPNGAAGDAGAVDLQAVVFDRGLKWISEASRRTESSCRSMLGKWVKDHGAEAVIATISAAQRQGVIEPIAWIEAAFRERSPPKSKGFN